MFENKYIKLFSKKLLTMGVGSCIILNVRGGPEAADGKEGNKNAVQ